MDYNEFLGRDETFLRNLLERSSSFPERRKIRAALKRLATPGTQPSSLDLHNGHAQTPIRRSNSEAEVKHVRLTNGKRRINGKCRDETFSQNEAVRLEACSHSVPADLCSLDVAGSSTDSGYYCDDQDSLDNQVTNMATTAVPQMTPEFGPDQRRRSSMIMGAYRVIKRNSVMLSESGLPSSPSPKSADAHAALQMASDINSSLQRRGSMGAGTNQRPRSHSVYPDHVTSPSWKQISSSSSANTASPPHPALLATHKARRRESYHVTSTTKPDHDRSLHNPANHPSDNPVRLDFEGNLRKHYPSPTSGSRHVTSAAQNEARKSRSESFSALRAKGRQLLSESETHSVPLSESARVLNSEASKTHMSESSRVLNSETLKPHTSGSSRVLTPEPPFTSHSTGSHTEPNTTTSGSPDVTDSTCDAAADQRTKSKFLSDLYSGQKKMTHLLNRSKSLLKVNELSKRQTQPIDQLLQSDFHRSSDDWPRNPPASTSAAEHLNGSHTGGDRNPPTTTREDVTNSILNSLPPLGFTSSSKVQTNYDVKGRASGDDHGDVRSVDSPFHRPREPSLSFEDVFTPGVSPGVSPAGQAVYKSSRRSSGHDVFDFSTQPSQTRSSSAKSFPPNISPALAKKLVKPSTEYRRFSFPDTSLDASEKLAEALKNVKNIQSKYTSHRGGSKYTSHPGGSKYTSPSGGSKDKRRGSLYSPQFLSDGLLPSSHALTSDDRKSRDIYLHPMSDLKPRRVPSSVGQRAVTQHVDQAHLRSHIDSKESRFDSLLVNQFSARDYSAAADDDSFDETDAVAYLKSTVRRASSSIVDYSRSKSRRGSTPAATDTRSRLLTETGLAGSRDMITVNESAERNRAKMLEFKGHHLRSIGIQESSPVASSDHSDVSSVSAGPGLSSAHSYKGLTGLHELQKLLSQTADSAERTKIRNVIRQLRHNSDAEQLKKAKTIKTGPDLDRRVGVSNSVRSVLTSHSEDSNPALSHYSHSSYDRTLGHHDKSLTTKPATSPSLPHQGLRASVHSDSALTHGSYEDGHTPKTDGSTPKTDPLIDESSRVLEEVRARLENRRASFNPDVKISLSSAHGDCQPEVTPSSVFTPRSDGVFRFPDSAAGSRPSVSDTTRRESLGSEKYRESRQQILESSGYVKRQSLTPDTVRQSLTPDTIRQSLNHDIIKQSSPQNSPQTVESFKKTSIMASQQENHTTGNDERISVDRTRQHDDRLGLIQHHTNSLVQVDNKGSYSAHIDTNGKLRAPDNDFSKLTTEVRSDQVELNRPVTEEVRLGQGLSAVTPQRSSEPMRSVQLIHAITDNFSKIGNYLDKMEGKVEGSRVTRTQSLHSHVRHELPPSVDLRTDVTVQSSKEAISDLSGNQHLGEGVQGHTSILPGTTAECQDISKLAIEPEQTSQNDVSSDVDFRDSGEGLVAGTDSSTETVEQKTTLSRGRPVGRSLTESRLSRPDRFRPDFTVLDKIDENSESSKPGAPRARRVAVAMPVVEPKLETEFNSRTGDTSDRTGQASDELTSHPDEPAPSPWHHDYSIHQAEAADQLADLDSRKPVNQEALAARRMRFSAPVYGLSPNLQLLDAAADDTQPKRRHSEIYNKMEAARIEQAFSSLLDDLDKISNSEGTVSDIDLSDNDDILALSDGSSGSCASTPHRPKPTSTSLPTGESLMKNLHHDVIPSEDIDVTDSIFNHNQQAVTTVLDSTSRDHQDTHKKAVTLEVTLRPTSMTDTVPSGDIVVSLEDTFTGHSVKEDVELTPVVSPGSSLPSPVAQHSVSAVDHTSTMTGENSIEPGSKTMDTDAEVTTNNNNIVMKSTSTLQLVTAPQPAPHPAPGVRTFHVNKDEDGTITMQAGAADENQNRVITVRTKKQRTPSNADEELKDKIIKKTMVSPGGAVIEETGVVHTKKRITSRGSNYFTRREYTTRTRRDKEGGETVEHDVTVETDNKSVSQGQSWGDKVVTRVNLEDAKTVNGLSSVQSVDDLPFADDEDTPAEAIPRPEVASSNKQLHLTGPPEVSQSLKDMDALEGRQVVLECRIKFPDTPHIVWFKDGQELSEADLYIGRYDELTGKATLTIPDATTFDTALYTCVGQNQVGEARTQCRVVIKRRPDNVPVFERGLCDVTVAEGNSVLLSCHVTGATSVTWQKNGVPQKHSQDARQSFDGREARLEMSDVYVDDAGLYSCLAQNEAGVQTSSCELIVKASASESTVVPMFLTKLTNATVYDGESLTLECEVVGSPEPNVFWLKDGKDLPQDLSFSTAYDGRQANLDLTGLRAEDAGRYTCVAENSGGKVTQDVFVTVQVTTPPSFTCSLQDITTTPGKGVLLRCEVSGVPQPTVAWKKNGAMLGMANNYINSYNHGVARLEVLAAGVEDSGRYECVASNVVGERSCGCVLTVQALKAVETKAPQEEQVIVAPPQVRRVFKKLSDPTPVSIISSMLQRAETKPADVTSGLHKPADVTSTLPRPADVISDLHKPADVISDLHKPADVTSTLHKPADVTSNLHKPADVTSTLPRPADVTSTLHKPVDVTPDLPRAEPKPADIITSVLKRASTVQRSHTFTPGSRTFQQSPAEVSREKVDNSGLQQPERIVAPQPVGVVRPTVSMTTQSTTTRDTSGADNRVLASAASLELKKHEAPPSSLTFSPSPAPRSTNLSRSVSLHVVRTSATSPENSSPGVKPGKSPSRESIAKAGSLEVITESVPLHLIPGYRSVSPHFLTSPDKHLSSSDSNIGQAPVTRLDISQTQTLSGSSSSSSVDNTSSSSSSYKQLSSSSSHLTTTASTASPSLRSNNNTNDNTSAASPSLRSYNNTNDNTSAASPRVESTITSTSSSLRIDNTPTASSTIHNNTPTASPSVQTEHSNTPVTKLSRVGQLQRQFLQNDQAAARDQQTTGVGVRRWHSLPPQESRPTVIKRDKSALPAPKLPTMPSYDDITDEEELHKLMNSTEDFEERKKIRSRLREIRDKQREDYEAKRKQREAEAEDLVKKKFEKAEEEKKKKMEAYKQQAPTHERESKYHEISQSLITDKHKAAEDEKAAKLAVYSHIAESTGPGGEKTVTKTTTTSSSEKTPGGTRTTTTTTKTETSTKSFGGTSYGKPAEETAQELTQRLMSASGPGVSGRITVKTESWNSADGKVQKSEKMQTWGAKPQSAMAAFKQMDNANAPAGGVKPKAALARSPSAIKQVLLDWTKAMTREYPNVEITNFSSSWNNGMAFCALIHHFFPNAFDFSALDPTKRRYNFTLAFDTAEKEADIAPLLDVDDMVKMKNPDWKCVFTYVQSIYRHLKDHEKNKTAAVEQ